MKIRDGLRLEGEATFIVLRRDPTDDELARILGGEMHPLVIRRAKSRNLVTNTGRSDITSRIINGAAVTIAGWIAVTQTAITPSATDTTLTGETARKANSTVAVLSTYYQRFVTTFTSADFGAVTITGAGLFTAAAAGNMWAIVSTSLVKGATESLVVDWRLQTIS